MSRVCGLSGNRTEYTRTQPDVPRIRKINDRQQEPKWEYICVGVR